MENSVRWHNLTAVLDGLCEHYRDGELRGILAIAVLKDGVFVTYAAGLNYVEGLGFLEAAKNFIVKQVSERERMI